jgi:hypothetical protein
MLRLSVSRSIASHPSPKALPTATRRLASARLWSDSGQSKVASISRLWLDPVTAR